MTNGFLDLGQLMKDILRKSQAIKALEASPPPPDTKLSRFHRSTTGVRPFIVIDVRQVLEIVASDGAAPYRTA